MPDVTSTQPTQSTRTAAAAGGTTPRLPTPGERLRALREERDISVDMLRRRTKIPLRTITALEGDDAAYYASDPYARSFLEQYCEFLGVDSAELRAGFEKAAEPLRRADNKSKVIAETSSPIEEDSYMRAAHAYFFKAAGLSAVIMTLLTVWLWKNADYFGWPAEAESAASPSVYEAAFISRLEGTVTARTWLRVTADNRTVFEGFAPAGVKLGWNATKEFRVDSDMPANLQLSLDNRKLDQFTKTQTRLPVVFSGADAETEN